MSWRNDTPQPVQDDMDGLLDKALTLAEEHLRERGQLFPFGLAVDRAGGTRVVDVDATDAVRAKEMLFAALSGMRGEIRAAAVVVDVVLPQTDSSGIEVHVEHAHGLALGALEPYTVTGGEVQAEPLEAYTAARAVW